MPRFLADLADAAVEAWTQPDHGIWEIRGEPRHFLYSKLTCWVALGRALMLAGRLEDRGRPDVWKQVRDQIRDALLEHGWSQEAGAFTKSFHSTALDGSALMLPITDFLPGDDPRVLATIDAIAQRLTDQHGLVHCSRRPASTASRGARAASCCARSGSDMPRPWPGVWTRPRHLPARRLPRQRPRSARRAADPESGAGSAISQAFSHIGLVNGARAIHQAEQSSRSLDEQRNGETA